MVADKLHITIFFFTDSFKRLTPKTQHLRVGAVRKIVDGLVHFMAPDEPKELWTQLLAHEKGADKLAAWSVPKLDILLKAIADY